MDGIEQRVIVNDFFLKGHGSKAIHKELVSTLQDNVTSLSAAKNWLRRFKSGDRSCDDEERPGTPLISLAGSSALSEEVSLCVCPNTGRTFLGGSRYYQEHS
jgi:hypothetical protein